MVVQGHDGALLDEEEDESVVLIRIDFDAVQIIGEVVSIFRRVRPSHAKRLDVDFIHPLDDSLTAWVVQRIIQEVARVACQLGLDTKLSNLVHESFHC